MRTRALALPLLALIAAAWLSPLEVVARPGGGSSFSGSRSSSSSSSSRSSSSSSSSSRSSSSSSSSRSSSGSSWGSSSSSRPSSTSSYPSGGSYPSSGGYYSSGGGGGGGSSGAVGLISAVVVLLLVVVVMVAIRRFARAGSGAADPDQGPAQPFGRSGGDPSEAFEQLRGFDPDFSRVVFEDFLYALYAEAHAARDPRRLAEMAPFLSAEARATLDRIHAGASSVSEFVIGSMVIDALRFVEFDGRQMAEVTVDYETNYTERTGAGEQSFLAIERWTLRRRPDARSRAPEQARVFQCPSCGAALSEVRGRTCGSCRQVVDTGEFDWVVASIEDAGREARPPMLTSDVEERGTDRPTVSDPRLAARQQELAERDPEFDMQALQARVQVIFAELQKAWSDRDWKRARPFVSDALFQMQLGYIEAYQRARLRNVTEDARIESLLPVKMASDRYFDSITVRLYASSLDFTVSDDGKLVAGSRDRRRRYSEYWTLIRGVGVKGRPRADKACPSCGAPLDVNMAGSCAYCKSRVGLGEFDWVLSRIEQDEAYQG